jgi:hypothetical protein
MVETTKEKTTSLVDIGCAITGGFMLSAALFVFISLEWLIQPAQITGGTQANNEAVSTILIFALVTLLVVFVTSAHMGYRRNSMRMFALAGMFTFYWSAMAGMLMTGSISAFMKLFGDPNQIVFAIFLLSGLVIGGYSLLVFSGAIKDPARVLRILAPFMVTMLVVSVVILVVNGVLQIGLGANTQVTFIIAAVIALVVTGFLHFIGGLDWLTPSKSKF